MKLKGKSRIQIGLLLLPGLLIFCIFTVYPIIPIIEAFSLIRIFRHLLSIRSYTRWLLCPRR